MDRRGWLACALTFFALILLHHQSLSAAQLNDEGMYRDAIFAASPSSVPGWYYPDTLARLGALIARVIGISWLFRILRLWNALGCALVCAFSARVISRRFCEAISLSLALTPIVYTNLEIGNVSGLLAGTILAATLSARWYLRSLTLAATLLVKPYALAVALARPVREAVLPVAVAALLFFDTHARFTNLDATGNAALIRGIHQLGIPLPWQVVTICALAASFMWSREKLARSFALAWLSLPLAWEHTAILLFVPWGVVAGEALRKTDGPEKRLALLGCLWAGVVIVSIKYWSWPDGPRWMSGLLGLVPAATVIGLGAATRLERSPTTLA
jgi:hypothetical protein